MDIILKVLELIKFPIKKFNLDFINERNELPDIQGIITIQKTNLNGEFIDYFHYLRREKEEFWNSLDIYIQKEKSENIFKLINNVLKQKNQINNDDITDFSKSGNNEKLFLLDIDEFNRLVIIKIDNKILVQIIRFYKNNFA